MLTLFIVERTENIRWRGSNGVDLHSPTSEQCEDVMSRLQLKKEYWLIYLHSLSPESMLVIINNISKCTVDTLTIYDTKLDSKCVSKLSEVLSSNIKLQGLRLSSSSLTGGIKQISDALVNNIILEVLSLRNICLTDEDITHLSDMIIVNKRLKTLDLENCNITDNSVRYICEGLTKNQTLTKLDISYNAQITSISASTIADLINTTTSLTELRLHGTSLNNDDIKTICTSLTKNTTIRKLFLSRQYEEYCKNLDSYQFIKDRVIFFT